MRKKPATPVIALLIGTFLLTSAPLAGAQTPTEAVTTSVTQAAASGVTSFISVVDRRTGAVVSRTANAGAQVASESIMKLFLAAYYLRSYPGGYAGTPQSVRDRLEYMLIYSDDGTASSMFTASAIPTIAAAYQLGATINATDRVGHWGAARTTASDVTQFLLRADRDPLVGPWLMPVLARTAATGSGADAGFSQYFGLNALSGEHGSKQGWGCDSYWTTPQCAVHSVGYTDRYFVAILQLGGYPDPMRSTSTNSARLIQQSQVALVDGDFICDSTTGEVFRLAGGAPIYVSNWNVFGGGRPCRSMSGSEIGGLAKYPADGTYLRDPISGAMYRVAGGAPTYIASFRGLGAGSPAIEIDPAAIDSAGSGGRYDHLRYFPADGTFIRGAKDGAVYRIAGGAPTYVSTWSAFGGGQPTTDIDTAAIDLAGTGGYYNHLRDRPADGTFIRGTKDGAVYRIAGGAPTYVSTWSAFGGGQPTTDIDTAAIDLAGTGGYYNHLRDRPADGTFIRGTKDGAVYRIAGGAPTYVSTWSAFGGGQPTTDIDTAAIDLAGTGGYYNHLRDRPADGTFIRGTKDGAVYRIAGGAPTYVSTWSAFGGGQPTTDIDTAAIDLAGTGGYYNHLRDRPADGTFIRGTGTGAVYRVAGGAPVYITSWTPFGRAQPAVVIDTAAIDRAGSGTFYNRLRFTPADGTFLQGLPGGRIYRVAAGAAVYVPSWDPFNGEQPYTPVTQQTIDLAGTGGYYDHLKPGR